MTDQTEAPTPWRQRTPLSRFVEDANGRFIFYVAFPDLAARIVAAVNAAECRPEPPRDIRFNPEEG